ncbi:MAG: hypothetical protein ACOYLH_06280 [Flavobacteriales bacterium]
MKQYFLSLTFLFFAMIGLAQNDIALKITYNGQAVCKYEITVKAGGGVLGKATTDDNGEIKLSGIGIKVVDVDVHGYKKTTNGEKTFDLQGYVKLDDNGFAHIQMETIVKDAAGDSGFPEGMLAAAWGLTDLDCGGTKSTGTGSGESIAEESAPEESVGSSEYDENENGKLVSKEESLVLQEQGFKNEIAMLDRKIAKAETTIAELKTVGGDETDIQIEELDLQEMKFKRERKKISLEKVQKAQAGTLTDTEKTALNQQEDRYSIMEKDLRAERKDLEQARKDKKKAEKAEEGGSSLEGAKLKSEILSVKTQIKAKETSLNVGKEKGKLTAEEIAQKEKELEELRARLTELENQK